MAEELIKIAIFASGEDTNAMNLISYFKNKIRMFYL